MPHENGEEDEYGNMNASDYSDSTEPEEDPDDPGSASSDEGNGASDDAGDASSDAEPGNNPSGETSAYAESEEDVYEEVDAASVVRNPPVGQEPEVPDVDRWSDAENDPSDTEETRENERGFSPDSRTVHIAEKRGKERAVRKIILALTMMGSSDTVTRMMTQEVEFRYDYTTMLYLINRYERRGQTANIILPLPWLIQDHMQYAMNPTGRTAYYQDREERNVKSLAVPCLIESFPFPDGELRMDFTSNFMSWAAYQEIRWTKKIVIQRRKGTFGGLSGRRTLGTVENVIVTFQGHQFPADFQVFANKKFVQNEVTFGRGLVEMFHGEENTARKSVKLNMCDMACRDHHYLWQNIHLIASEREMLPSVMELFFKDLGNMGQLQRHVLGWNPLVPHIPHHIRFETLFQRLRIKYADTFSYRHFLAKLPDCIQRFWYDWPPR